MQADGTLYTVVLESAPLNPATFSPDGITIAYTDCHANLGHQLYLHHGEAGSQPVEWGRYGLGGWEVSIYSTSWSPEGNRLACWATGRHEQEQVEGIILLDLVSKTSEILFPLNHPVYFDSYPPAPAWSPDGQWLAFWGIDENRGNPGIRVVSTDGHEVYAVPGFSDDYWDRGIVWSPDGHWMAFAYDESDSKTGVWLAEVGTWELFQTDLPSGSKVIEWIDDLP
jgi:TolB protein